MAKEDYILFDIL